MRRLCLFAAVAALLPAGCHSSPGNDALKITLEPAVTVVTPAMHPIIHTIEQPGYIRAYERTAVYAKVAGWVKEWCVEKDATVKEGELLVVLDLPEVDKEYKQKQAQVALDKAAVDQAAEAVKVADHNWTASKELVKQAEAKARGSLADMERYVKEFELVKLLVKEGSVQPQQLDDTAKRVKTSEAEYQAANANSKIKESQERAAGASVDKAKADWKAAQAKVQVSEADAQRSATLLSFAEVRAPYAGKVTARNVNKGDMVKPATGDSTASQDPDGQSPDHATPLYVITKTDKFMFVVGVPETDAQYIKEGAKATVRVPALAGMDLDNVTVSRTSWSLHAKSRTLLAEIDIINPDPNLRPGMYAYGSIKVERSKHFVVPVDATIEIGNQACCYLLVDGKAMRTPVQLGLSDGKFIEVTKKRVAPKGTGPRQWVEFRGDESVIVGNLGELMDRQKVTIRN